MNYSTRAHRSGLALVSAMLTTGVMPGIAFAHHGMDGETPNTFYEGLLSGLAHPVIGLDHMAMILLVGAYAGVMRLGVLPIVSFVGAGMLGCFAHLARLDLPRAETWLAVSLVLAGLVMSAALKRSARVTSLVLFATGLLHGYAYGESMVGAESTPIVAYLLGLVAVQAGLAFAVSRAVQAAQNAGAERGSMVVARVLGAASVAVGLLALI